MKRKAAMPAAANAFDVVRTVGLALPGVEASTKYDGSPVLKRDGCFMAGLATHPSAEPDTLIVRAAGEEREWLLEEAPETYYLTDYYRRHPIVLVRLSRIDRDALRDLLTVSWRLTSAKARKVGPRAVLVCLLAALLWLPGPAGAQQADPQSSESLERIRARLQSQQRSLTDETILWSVPAAPERRLFGVLTFLPPETPGEFLRVRVPAGALVVHAVRAMVAVRRGRAEKGARAEVARALSDFQKAQPPR